MSERGPGGRGAPEVDEARRRVVTWLWRLPVLAALGGAGYGAWRFALHLDKTRPDEAPAFAPAGPEPVAPLAAFDAPWRAVEFALAGVPAVALRLPEALPGALAAPGGAVLAGYSRVCTHQGCLVNLARDPEALAALFNHRMEHPALACACHFSVFDPLRSGAAVSGPARQPLPRVRLELDGDVVVATGLEPG